MCAKTSNKRAPDELVKRILRSNQKVVVKSPKRSRGTGLLRQRRAIKKGGRPSRTPSGTTSVKVDFVGRRPTESSEVDVPESPPKLPPKSSPAQKNGSIQSAFHGGRPSNTASDPSSNIEDDFLGRRPSTRSSEPSSDDRRQLMKTETVKLRSTTDLLIPREPFQQLVREILLNCKNDFRVQSSTLACLQEAAESYLIGLFEDSFLLSLHRSCETLSVKDIRFTLMLK